MTRRYLFGPAPSRFAEQNLLGQRQAGHCLVFDSAGTADLAVRPGDTWEAVSARFPQGWQPDFLVLRLPERSIPACLWAAPVPIIGLAGNWRWQWHWYRRRLRSCELILTDPAAVAAFHREGLTQARPANLAGFERDSLDKPLPDDPRDIDILFLAADCAPPRQGFSLLERLARLGELAFLCSPKSSYTRWGRLREMDHGRGLMVVGRKGTPLESLERGPVAVAEQSELMLAVERAVSRQREPARKVWEGKVNRRSLRVLAEELELSVGQTKRLWRKLEKDLVTNVSPYLCAEGARS